MKSSRISTTAVGDSTCGKCPTPGKHFKPATRHGGVSGVTVGDRDDPILIPPDQQDR